MSPMLSSHEGGGAWPGGLSGPLAGLGRRASTFGDGTYSNNIIQGGSVLQPVNGVITITGAATIVPDASTLCAFACGHTLVLDGVGASLSPSAFCRGLFVIFKRIEYKNGAGASMTSFGYPGEVLEDPNLFDLIPAAYQGKFKRSFWSAQTLRRTGAAGAAARVGNGIGITGGTGVGRQTGGGGSGAVGNSGTSGKGGAGTAFSGGSGGGSTVNSGACGDANEFGGAGGFATYANSTAGAGRPPGAGGQGCTATGAGGIMIMAAEEGPFIGAGSVLQADGVKNTPQSVHTSGGSTGGGGILIYHAGTYTNLGTLRANGGPAGDSSSGLPGGPGGAGYTEAVNAAQAA